MTCISVNGLALSYGPLVTLAVYLAISPVGPVLLVLAAERRLVRPRDDYLSFLFGDVLLAVAVAVSVDRRPAAICGMPPVAQWSVLAAGVVAGVAQWRLELRGGAYSRPQAVSPSKIWHQVLTLPLFGAGLLNIVFADVIGRVTGLPVYLLQAAAVAGWLLLLVHDNRGLKLGHTPFSWRPFGPLRRPWAPASRSLHAHAASCREG